MRQVTSLDPQRGGREHLVAVGQPGDIPVPPRGREHLAGAVGDVPPLAGPRPMQRWVASPIPPRGPGSTLPGEHPRPPEGCREHLAALWGEHPAARRESPFFNAALGDIPDPP